MGGGIAASLFLCGGDLVSCVCVALGSVLPDIDHPGSMVGKNVPLLPRLLRHRGVTHSLLFCVLASLVNGWLGVGCLVHIVMDMMTRQGVELFWPMKKKFRFPLAKCVVTNGWFEKILYYSCYLFIGWRLYVILST